jgi:hypothetical protein
MRVFTPQNVRSSTVNTASVLKYVGALAFVFFSSVALAQTERIYPGNTCIATGAYAEEAEGYVNGLWNRGTHDLNVKCPVVRTNITNTTGTNSAKISVESNGTDFLECRLWVHDKDGVFVDSHADSTTNNAPTVLDIDVNLSQTGANYSISCNLPPSGWIYSYKIVEP